MVQVKRAKRAELSLSTPQVEDISEDSRHEPLLATAARMFAERGYLGTSLDDIAGALGSTKGRIYHYFNSKADLYLAVHRAAMLMIMDEVGPLAALPIPPVERLRLMAAAQLRMVMLAGPIQKAGMVGLQRRTIKMTTVRQKQAMALVLDLRDQYETLFASVIQEGITAGDFADRPVRSLTKPLQGALNYTHVWFDPARPTSRDDLERLISVIVDYVVGGLFARPSQPEPAQSKTSRKPVRIKP